MTKKDQTLKIAINSIKRLETKIEELTDRVDVLSHNNSAAIPTPVADAPLSDPDGPTSPVTAHRLPSRGTISFSQHGVLQWPAILKALPVSFVEALSRLPRNYAVELERTRIPLSSDTALFPEGLGREWLNDLPVRIIRALIDAFFSTFNGLFPVLDRRHFFSYTLGKALDNEFDDSVESTTVLLALALGCLAVEGHREGDYSLRKSPAGEDRFVAPDWCSSISGEEYPGLSFFNEARKRIGFRTGSGNLYNSQNYLLCAFYYTQIIRPIDSYIMLVSAALCSSTTLSWYVCCLVLQ